MAASPRLLIVPRWAGRPGSDYYPWLRQELERGPHPSWDEIEALDMPHPESPVIDAWVAHLSAHAGTDPAVLRRTVLLGHSVGGQAVLRFLATLPAGTQVQGVLCVAGWWTVDRPWETILPWMNTPIDLARVRAAAPRLLTLLSDNDPFTADFEANRSAWADRAGAQVTLIPGAAHFNRAEEPAVLAAVQQMARAPAG